MVERVSALSCCKTILNKLLQILYFVIIDLLEINKCHMFYLYYMPSLWSTLMLCSVTGGGLPFRCLLCGRAYKRRDNLTRHQRYECLTSEPQFLCTVCPYKAKQKVHLKTHMAIRHGEFISNKQ